MDKKHFGQSPHAPRIRRIKETAWNRGLWRPEPDVPKPDRAAQRQAALDRLEALHKSVTANDSVTQG